MTFPRKLLPKSAKRSSYFCNSNYYVPVLAGKWSIVMVVKDINQSFMTKSSPKQLHWHVKISIAIVFHSLWPLAAAVASNSAVSRKTVQTNVQFSCLQKNLLGINRIKAISWKPHLSSYYLLVGNVYTLYVRWEIMPRNAL